jgi:carboxyl-terminal processing protease
MTLKKRTLALLLVLALALGSGLTLGIQQFSGTYGVGSVLVDQSDYDRLVALEAKYGKLEALYQTILDNYYDDIDEDALMTGIYKGLFDGIGDVYSTYMTKDEYESWVASALGEFEGIGITFTQDDDDNFVVISTISGSPADKAGLRTGDIILMVDGKAYEELEALGAAIRGDAGSKVEITYLRGEDQKTVSIIRAKIVSETVVSRELAGGIGYIQITSFEEHTAEDFEAALHEFEVKGLKGLVIDLRNNGGGLVDQGVAIADLLMGKGTITYLMDRDGNKETYSSDTNKTSLPFVLLVNGGTASTSEILSAAIKDSKDGLLVGETTFGKGIVQSTTQLPDGDAVKLTIKQYFSPDGNVIHKIGVEPDYAVTDNPDTPEDEALNKALALLQ